MFYADITVIYKLMNMGESMDSVWLYWRIPKVGLQIMRTMKLNRGIEL